MKNSKFLNSSFLICLSIKSKIKNNKTPTAFSILIAKNFQILLSIIFLYSEKFQKNFKTIMIFIYNFVFLCYISYGLNFIAANL